jgi:hypothetical protein
MRFAHGEAAVMFEHVTLIGVDWAETIELAVLKRVALSNELLKGYRPRGLRGRAASFSAWIRGS